MPKLINWKKQTPKLNRSLLHFTVAIAGTLAALVLSAAIICMYNTSPIGDDFGAITSYHSPAWLANFFESLSTTGRYGQSITSSIAYGILGRHTPSILSLGILSWMTLLYYLYGGLLAKRLQIKTSNYLLIFIALLFTSLTLFAGKGFYYETWFAYQLFFWPSGEVTYTIPLLILLTASYILINKKTISYRTQLIAFSVTVYVTGLFNEVQPATVIGFGIFIALASLVPILSSLKKFRSFALAAAGSSLLSLLTLFFSAGSQNRQNSIAGQVHHENLVNNVLHNLSTIFTQTYWQPRDILICVSVGILAAILLQLYKRGISSKRAIGMAALAFCLWSVGTICSLVLVGYGYGDGSPVYARTLLIPQVANVLTLLLLGISWGILIASRKKDLFYKLTLMAISIALILCLPKYINSITTQLTSSLDYTNTWRLQDVDLKQKALTNPNDTVYLPPSAAGIGDGFSLRCYGPYSSSTIWLNDLIEKYYGLREICSTQDKVQN